MLVHSIRLEQRRNDAVREYELNRGERRLITFLEVIETRQLEAASEVQLGELFEVWIFHKGRERDFSNDCLLLFSSEDEAELSNELG